MTWRSRLGYAGLGMQCFSWFLGVAWDHRMDECMEGMAQKLDDATF